MASVTFAVGSELTNKLWSKKAELDTLQQTYARQYMGSTAGSLCQEKTELSKNAGDKVTFALRNLLTGAGSGSSQVLYGNEEATSYAYDSLVVDELNHSTEVPGNGTIDAQRVPFSLMDDATSALTDWNKERLDTWFFNQLAGNTAVTDLRYCGNNATIAPSSGTGIYKRHIIKGQTTENSLGTTDLFSLDLIDNCVEIARTSRPRIRPLANGKYVIFIHEYQATDLRQNTASGQWFDIARAQIEGGKGAGETKLFTTAIGEYHDTIIVRSSFLPQALDTAGAPKANTRRAVFCGAQALTCAWGRAYQGGSMRMEYETKDYKRKLGVASLLVGGMKKTVYNGVDYGVITVSSYAAPHTT